jgi:hypothetical protein
MLSTHSITSVIEPVSPREQEGWGTPHPTPGHPGTLARATYPHWASAVVLVMSTDVR